MSLKYNSRALLEEKLSILKCCICTKGIELSDKIALAIGDTDCLVQELEVLNKYYDILSCYYPYDCWTETGCTPAQVLETYQFLISTADLETIATWISDEQTVYAEIYSIVDGDIYTVDLTTPPFLIVINNYINTNSAILGYTSSFVVDDDGATFTLTKLDCDTPIFPNSSWGFNLINETLIEELEYIEEPEGTSTCACEEECCNVKVITEVIEYTIDQPQVLETGVFQLLHGGGDGGTIQTWLTNLNSINIRIYNLLTGTQVVLPYIYTSTNRNTLYTYIRNYINANRFILGYTISVLNDIGSDVFTMTMLNCSTASEGNWGFDIINTTLSTTISRNSTPLDDSTCATYTETVVHPEAVECQENCLTDEQVEKIIRHAMSLCECCSDIYLNNNLE